MQIPRLHYISQGKTPQEHLNNIHKACASGAELVQLRLKKLTNEEVLKVAEEVRDITSKSQTRLIINDYYKIAREVKADGVHLGKNDTCPTIAKAYLEEWQIIGGTANTLEDCKSLIDKKVDYIGLGPFRFTKTKENLSAIIGRDGYAVILKELQTATPIIAIGGITLNDIAEILKTGVYGVAVSGEITKDFSTLSRFNQLLEGSSLQEHI